MITAIAVILHCLTCNTWIQPVTCMIFITSPERSKRQGPFLDIPHQGTRTSNINWAGKETDQNPHLIYILLRLLVITTVIPKSRVSAEKQPVVLLSKSNCASAFPDTRCMHFDFFPASRFELLPSSSSIMRTARTARNGKATTSRQHRARTNSPGAEANKHDSSSENCNNILVCSHFSE